MLLRIALVDFLFNRDDAFKVMAILVQSPTPLVRGFGFPFRRISTCLGN
jgi:hypothetical protein